ncbi:hypothetical protein [Williamsia sp.]|uniref:hypothetical protein n=1 Tax=Williamsia sp. TaxID=1872085 RepID=UPI002F9232BC
MARGMDPESRPISVAELLARAKEQGADDVAEAVGSSPAATGRRRRGGKDAVSVAELTGEIPRVNAQPQADQTTQPQAEEKQQPKGEPAEAEGKPAPTATPPKTTPPPTRDFSTADVSKRATAPAEPATRPTPGAPDRPAPFGAKPVNPEAPADSVDTPAEVSEPTADEEATGVIASMQAYSQVDDGGEDDHRVLSAAERERDFERYRNFEDVETGDEGNSGSSGTKKKKRGLFGFGRKSEAASTPATDGDLDDNGDHAVTQFIPKVADESAPGVPVAEAPSAPGPKPDPMSPPREQAGAVAAGTGRYLRFDQDDDVDTAKSVKVADESPTSQFGQVRQADAPVAPVVNLDKDSESKGGENNSAGREIGGSETATTSLDKPVSGPSTSGRDPETKSEQSPTVQWLLLIGQVIAGLAVGVALFWGFTELWRWNVLFALVLSVAVIFGLVTLVHVVRRSNDLISTLLALGVGLLVTIGPLVLLLIAGD